MLPYVRIEGRLCLSFRTVGELFCHRVRRTASDEQGPAPEDLARHDVLDNNPRGGSAPNGQPLATSTVGAGGNPPESNRRLADVR